MKTYVTDEKGNASLYLLWLLGIVALLFIIVLNMTKAFLTGHEASSVVEQAAFSGTSVYIRESKQAIADFDGDPDSILTRPHHGGKTIGELISEKQTEHEGNGYSPDQAYIKALNDVLPGEIDAHSELKDAFVDRFSSVSINDQVFGAVQSIIQNHADANPSDTRVILSNTDWRLEVESTVTFKSISDSNYIPVFQEKISSTGYGPKLLYLENVYN
ncbi:hypothetical protein [Salinibacillus xinjiangensis]|uniref:Uncharacterized protein n=1 Tax=Salinibacillus xinjiangensis TaxID=1229268 RepID=A0A6G1X8W8_9BACI|nr:hypothetical protein [Salinibacillus xinjiangensis]MRG87387.1 hypothetical protein [Salinibacillus xinjiangensis]